MTGLQLSLRGSNATAVMAKWYGYNMFTFFNDDAGVYCTLSGFVFVRT